MTLQWRQRPFRALLWGMAGLLAITVAASIVWRFLLTGPRTRPYDRIVQGSVAESPISPESESRIKAFCGDCHAVPRPESFHRDLWHEEVLRGYEFYVRSGRNDLDPPPIHETVAYFRARAPERMAYPQPKEAETPLGVSFSFEKVPLDALAGLQPAIAHLCWTRLPGEKRPFLLACDMLSGQILAVDLRDPKLGREVAREELLATVLRRFEELYEAARRGQPVHLGWKAHLDTLGRRIRVRSGEVVEQGVAEDVEPDGTLILRRPDGSHVRIEAGEVTLKA
jgi:hypothetical protein